MLGQVDSANFSAPFNYMPKMKYSSPWINDDFKVTPKLTLTFGLRLTGKEAFMNNMADFPPSIRQRPTQSATLEPPYLTLQRRMATAAGRRVRALDSLTT